MQCLQNPEDRLERLYLWVDDVGRSPAEHMACDELLLSLEHPTLRAYRWNAEAVSVGVMASARESMAFSGSRPWVRRWTGGGIVEHGCDLTLAFAAPAACISTMMNARDWYCWMHRAALRVLTVALPEARLATPADMDPGAQCFQSPVDADVLIGNQKILGGALRIHRSGVLYQGSLQSVSMPEDFPQSLGCALADQTEPWIPTWEYLESARRLSEIKYLSNDWMNRHP